MRKRKTRTTGPDSSFAVLRRTGELISEARARLENVGLIVVETPFGYLNEWKIHVAGDFLAKVFKDL